MFICNILRQVSKSQVKQLFEFMKKIIGPVANHERIFTSTFRQKSKQKQVKLYNIYLALFSAGSVMNDH